MPENRSRYVVLCQQMLAFGTVVALVAPAASVVTLDIVAPAPPSVVGGDASSYAGESRVASAPVRPTVSEVPVDGIEAAGLQAVAASSGARPENASGQLKLASGDQRTGAEDEEKLAALTRPEPVSGYATVGVTWKHGTVVDEGDITVSVRSLDAGTWSDWQEIDYHDDHGPDTGSEEARRARPGTDPIIVGDVDKVQVRTETATGEIPADMQLALVDPGRTADPVVEKPAIDTAKLGADAAAAPSAADSEAGVDPNAPAARTTDQAATDQAATDQAATDQAATDQAATDQAATDAATLTAAGARATSKPKIYSRAQWGADERMREKSSLHYYEVHAGFVHHTVNANDYTRAQVPSLLRGIYAYHTQSKGWSDIGYNFVVDRFGRIWEGRYGGVARPVVGAHTLGYNDYSFAMSALGNFDVKAPSSAMLEAYGRLFAWKLSLHGVDVSSGRQWVGSKYFRAINGHRDAGQTACPGRYLYNKLPTIRRLAAKYERPFTSRTRSTDISGSAWPDLVVRKENSQRAYVVRTAGQVDFQPRRRAGWGWKQMDLIAAGRDLTGDGIPDMVGRVAATGDTGVYPGTSRGTFGAAVSTTGRFADMEEITGVLDMDGDGKNDLVARDAGSKTLYLFRGNDNGGFYSRRVLAAGWSAYDRVTGVGDMTGDGKNDLAARDRTGRLWLMPGSGDRSLGGRVLLGRSGWGSFDLLSGTGDVTNDGLPDIVARKRSSKLTYIYPGDGRSGLGHWYGAFSGFKGVDFLASAGQLAGNGRSDLVGRTGKRLYLFTNTGNHNLGGVVDTGSVFSNTNLVLNVGDWNRDGNGDVMTRAGSTGRMYLRAGNGRGRFAAPVLAATGWNSVKLAAAVGDITGDGLPDLMGQPRGGSMRIYPGNGDHGFRRSYAAHSAISSTDQVGAGLWDSDGSPDSILRRSDGTLAMYPGNGPGGLMNPRKVGSAGRYDWVKGVGDADGDGHPDLIARERSSGYLWLLPGTGSAVDARRFIGKGFGSFDLSG